MPKPATTKRATAPTAMPAMAPVPSPPIDRVDCEVLLVLGWLTTVFDGDVVYSPLVVVVPEDNVFVAPEVGAAAWPSWVTYIRTHSISNLSPRKDHDFGREKRTTYRTCQDGRRICRPSIVTAPNV
jgi:hypothetical protein